MNAARSKSPKSGASRSKGAGKSAKAAAAVEPDAAVEPEAAATEPDVDPDIAEPDIAETEVEVEAVEEPGDATAVPEPGADSENAAAQAPEELSELDAALIERDSYLESLQRVTAEFANYRRQAAKRSTEQIAQGVSKLVRELLPVLDACEAAVAHDVEGIDAIQSQLLRVLGNEGLATLGEVDEPFDPVLHEAAFSEESDDDSEAGPVVAEVLRTGYTWNGQVLRAAMVKVRG